MHEGPFSFLAWNQARVCFFTKSMNLMDLKGKNPTLANFGMGVETEKGSFLARREWELRIVWEKQFEREVLEKVKGRRTGTRRAYGDISEEKNR